MEAGGRAERQAEGSSGSRESPCRGFDLTVRAWGHRLVRRVHPRHSLCTLGCRAKEEQREPASSLGEPGSVGGGRDGGLARRRDVMISRRPQRWAEVEDGGEGWRSAGGAAGGGHGGGFARRWRA